MKPRAIEAAYRHPALLAWNPQTEIRICSVQTLADNNSFSVGDYNRWNGAVWDETIKYQILSSIPGSRLRVRAGVNAEGPGVASGGWAVTSGLRFAGNADLPAEAARLLLFGNTPGRSFSLEGSGGEAVAWSEFRISHGREIGELKSRFLPAPVRLALGGTLKILRGWGHAEVLRATGGIQTDLDGMRGVADLVARTAQGGNGVGLDLSLAAQDISGWQAALTLNNVFSRIRWSRRTEIHQEKAVADSVTLGDLESEADLVTHDSSTRARGAYSRSLSPELNLIGYRRWGPWTLAPALSQGFQSRPGRSKIPRLLARGGYQPDGWVELRLGLAAGGSEAWTSGFGIGLRLWALDLDLSTSWTGDPFDPRGLGLGFSLGLHPGR